MNQSDLCILNGGRGAWAFEPLARQLADAIGIDISPVPRRLNYVLCLDPSEPARIEHSFIPLDSIELAADKRLLAQRFAEHGVPRPQTELLDTFPAVQALVAGHPDRAWCLKFPTGCGANGHRLLPPDAVEPRNWPRPFVVQEFIRMPSPEVFRLYGAGGELFGWNVRRYAGGGGSPWVAHARGARYEFPANDDQAPAPAIAAARLALEATDLLSSFGCADLMQGPDGNWLVLEVGTDGLYNHVDRDLGNTPLVTEIHHRIAQTFRQHAAVLP